MTPQRFSIILTTIMVALVVAMPVGAATEKAPSKGIQIKIEWGVLTNQRNESRITLSSNPAQSVLQTTYTPYGSGGTIQLDLTNQPDVRIYAGPYHIYGLTAVMYRLPGVDQAFLMSNWLAGQCKPGPTVTFNGEKGTVTNSTGGLQYVSEKEGKWKKFFAGDSVVFKKGDTIQMSPTASEYNLCLRTQAH